MSTSSANEAIVSLVHNSFWLREGRNAVEPYDGEGDIGVEEAARRATTLFGDRLAEIVSAAWASPAVRDILEAIDGSADPDEMLPVLQAALRREGLI